MSVNHSSFAGRQLRRLYFPRCLPSCLQLTSAQGCLDHVPFCAHLFVAHVTSDTFLPDVSWSIPRPRHMYVRARRKLEQFKLPQDPNLIPHIAIVLATELLLRGQLIRSARCVARLPPWPRSKVLATLRHFALSSAAWLQPSFRCRARARSASEKHGKHDCKRIVASQSDLSVDVDALRVIVHAQAACAQGRHGRLDR